MKKLIFIVVFFFVSVFFIGCTTNDFDEIVEEAKVEYNSKCYYDIISNYGIKIEYDGQLSINQKMFDAPDVFYVKSDINSITLPYDSVRISEYDGASLYYFGNDYIRLYRKGCLQGAHIYCKHHHDKVD